MSRVRIAGRSPSVASPAIFFRAQRYSPFSVVVTSRAFTSMHCPRAKPRAALEGLPASSKATLRAGPSFSITWSSCLSATSSTAKKRRRGVPMVRISPWRIRFSASSFPMISSISLSAFGRKAAGISSVPISSSSSFPITSCTPCVRFPSARPGCAPFPPSGRSEGGNPAPRAAGDTPPR